MLSHRLQDERGTTVVEFAIGATVFFTVILLIMQGALMFQGWLAVTQASREAARFGAPCFTRSVEPCTVADIQARATAAAAGVNPAQLTGLQVNTLNSVDGKLLEVRLSFRVPIIAPLVGALIPKGLTLSASSAMRVENQ